MNLKQLKLTGFKSFVDHTVVDFPSQLVSVVGPNGCGKSNIIDAVRWVMGESSAKNLRGESMADVIFNGSSNRKPLGQASVELVFDNSLGRLAGPFTSYNEISVKRTVTRDGDSSYYLNGSRCRRKDITDIFLGTGAGARGYSIIGQGTISQLIEARPEDLRVFLEEAAGVSKYKERRRETLQRIEHTRENLTRVADIREELDKQLQRLERQAKAAERYKILKTEEQTFRAQKEALKWQEYTVQQKDKQRLMQEAAVAYEAQQSILTGVAKERTELTEQIHDADDKNQQIQTSFYQLGTEIARLEESVRQQEKEKRRLEQEKSQLQDDWQNASRQLILDKEELLLCQQQEQELIVQIEQLRAELLHKEQQYLASKTECSTGEMQWQEIQDAANSNKRDLELIQRDLQHLQQRRQQTLLRLEKLTIEQTNLSLDDLQKTKLILEEKQQKLQETQQYDEEQLKQGNEAVNQMRSQLKSTEEHLHQMQDEFHRVNSEYAALLATQKAARQGLNESKELIPEWQDKPRLMDVLDVDAAWQSALEMVLGQTLQSVVLDEFNDWWSKSQSLAGNSLVTLYSVHANKKSMARLADKVKGDIPANTPHLEHIYCVDTLEEAKEILPMLSSHESIITKTGFWLGLGWAKNIATEQEDEVGVLARQQRINELSVTVQTIEQEIAVTKTLRDQYHQELQQAMHYAEIFQLNLNGSNESLRANTSEIANNAQAIQHAERFLATMASECEELHLILEDTDLDLENKSNQLQQLQEKNHQIISQQTQISSEKLRWNEQLHAAQNALDEARAMLHQYERSHDKEKTKIHHLTEKLNQEEGRCHLLQDRLEQLVLHAESIKEPEVDIKATLDEQLAKHLDVETQLIASREQLSQLRLSLETLEKLSSTHEQELKKIQETIAQLRMEEQALAVRASSVQEFLQEQGVEVQDVLLTIPMGITQAICEENLIDIHEKIKRLGAINLAAIEEYETEQQRKSYLDGQYNDLMQALATLETAIEKMDDETRLRLENTFDAVNTSFKALFPRLFGGGRAQLELTCDNLLEAGIVVMAQPPGKRNSTIHLLSGGEKAMTAVALVFAIFQLNPSPFCMLDEVDAPLDDVNVGRFCDLVKEMSQFVQFLFITHNKVTMELADHLIGVTMREPGVSRLVAVDVKQALAME